MFQPQAVRIGWYKDNSVYIRTAMPFSTRLSLKPLQYNVHLSTIEVHFPIGAIYAQASSVPIWLGPASRSSGTTFDLAATLSSLHKERTTVIPEASFLLLTLRSVSFLQPQVLPGRLWKRCSGVLGFCASGSFRRLALPAEHSSCKVATSAHGRTFVMPHISFGIDRWRH
jgi:hypothetical protein